MPPSQHDPFFGFGLPEPGPIGPRLSAELDPLACALSRLEGWTEGLESKSLDQYMDALGSMLGWSELGVESDNLYWIPQDSYWGNLLPRSAGPNSRSACSAGNAESSSSISPPREPGVPHECPSQGHREASAAPDLGAGDSSGPAHGGLLPPGAWDRRVGGGRGAMPVPSESADDEDQSWCMRQHLMVSQEECAECEHGDDADGSGHYYCAYEIHDGEEEQG